MEVTNTRPNHFDLSYTMSSRDDISDDQFSVTWATYFDWSFMPSISCTRKSFSVIPQNVNLLPCTGEFFFFLWQETIAYTVSGDNTLLWWHFVSLSEWFRIHLVTYTWCTDIIFVAWIVITLSYKVFYTNKFTYSNHCTQKAKMKFYSKPLHLCKLLIKYDRKFNWLIWLHNLGSGTETSLLMSLAPQSYLRVIVLYLALFERENWSMYDRSKRGTGS